MRLRLRPLPALLLAALVLNTLLMPMTGGSVAAAPRQRAPRVSQVVTATRDGAASAAPATIASVQQAYGRLPLRFEQNVGQTDARVSYLARGGGYTLYLTGNAAMIALVQRPPQPRHPWDSAPTATATATMSATATAALTPPSSMAPTAPLSTPLTGTSSGTLTATASPTPTSTTPVTTTALTATVPITVAAVRLRFVDANAAPTVSGEAPLPGTANYFIGSDPHTWHTGVATYARVRVHDLYPGIDLLYDGSQGRLEYTWAVAPGADPGAIALAFDGAQGLQLDAAGALLVHTAVGTLTQPVPVAYQLAADGARQPVAARYTLTDGTRVGLALGAYDTSRPLIIDPVLSYSTYLGGSGDDTGNGIAVDASGAAYVTGGTTSLDFPASTGVYTQTQGDEDAFVTKLSPDGRALVYSTYLGGSAEDQTYGIAVDTAGHAFVAGYSYSTDYPTVRAPAATNAGSSDAVVSELSADGRALLYSTYVGGGAADYGLAIALDAQGNIYVVGQTGSWDFPTLDAVQPAQDGTATDAFVLKASADGQTLLYSTYLGGSGDECAYGVAVDGQGRAYVVGQTNSADFPTANAAQATYGDAGDPDGDDAFAAALSADGQSLVYSTYLGGSGDDIGSGVAVTAAGRATFVGMTRAADFPTHAALQPTFQGASSAFVTTLSAGGSFVYSTYLGGDTNDQTFQAGENQAYGVALDAQGDAYVGGDTGATDFPTEQAVQGANAGGDTGFVTALSADGSTYLMSTYLGGSGEDWVNGIALDPSGNAYVTGVTSSTDFPTTAGAPQGSAGGGTCDGAPCTDAFAARLGQSSGAIPWHPHQSVPLGGGLSLAVDLADGHADVGTSDLAIPGRGLDLTLARIWDSTLAQAGGAGTIVPGLASSLTPRMGGVLTGTVAYTDSTGAVWPFVYTGSVTATAPYTAYTVPAGQPWQLATSPTGTTGYTLTDVLTGEAWRFDAQGRYLSDTDSYGNQDSLTQGTSGPTSETNSGGRSLAFGYQGGQLADAQSPLWQSGGAGAAGSQHVSYGYNASGQLTARTQGAGTTDAVTATFGYSGTQLVTITTPYTQATRTWTLGYDSAGRVGNITSPISGTPGQAGYTPAYTTQFSYLPGQTQVVPGYGTTGAETTTYTLDGQGQAVAVTDALSHTTQTSYDQDHDVLSSTDPNNNTTQNYYQYVGPTGSTGLVTETVQPAIQPYSPLNGGLDQPATRHVYDPSTHDLTETDLPEGGKDLYGYDGHHSVITTTALLNSTTSTWRGTINGYDSYGALTSVTDGRGVTVNSSGVASLAGTASQYTRHLGYDTQGDQTAAGTAPITTTLNGVIHTSTPVTTTYGYDGDGNQTSTVSANGNTTTDGYDHLGRAVTTTLPTVTLYTGSPATPVETTRYDGDGNLVQQTDGNGALTQDSYDPLGRLIAETNPVSGTTVYTYNATEQTQVQDPLGDVTSDQYDAAGRLITETAPISGVTQYAYDAAGNTTVITQADTQLTPIQVDTRQYDASNRVITDTLSGPAGPTLTTATRYDHDGNTYQVVRPAGDAVVNTYDLADELVSTEVDTQSVAAATHQTQATYGYDAAGNQTQTTDYGGDATTSTYDGDNRLIQSVAITGTSSLTITNGYDPDGNVLTATVQLALPGSPVATTVNTATYNAADWQTSLADNGLATSYGYDAAGQLRTRSTSNGQILDTLDAQGRTTAISATGAGVSSYSYNADDQPVTATLPGGLSGSMAYDKDTRLTTWNLVGPSTGVTTTTVNLQYGYGYDAANRTTALTLTDNGVNSVRPITHDAEGRITGWVGPGPNGQQTWTYTADGNISSTTGLVAGAVRTTVFTYSATQPNELVQQHTEGFGVATYTRDSYGNLTSETSTDPPSSPLYVHKTFSYDALERPISSTNVQNGATITATLGYNALSERITYTAVMSGQVIDNEHFAYNADGSLARTIATTATLNQNGTIKSSGAYTDTYAYDPAGAPLYLLRQQNGTTNAYTYLSDGHGNVTGLADSSGHRVNRDDLNPFGAPVGVGLQETVPQNFRLAGLWGDTELGQNFVDNRYADVVSGFDQPDTSSGARDYVFENDDSVDTCGGSRIISQSTAAVYFTLTKMREILHSSEYAAIQYLFDNPTVCYSPFGACPNINPELALLEFGRQFKANGPWDFKSQIKRVLGLPSGGFSRVPGDTSYVYYFDIWTNFIYGYIGTSLGIDAKTLHDAAAGTLPLEGILGSHGQEDRGDVLSESIGIDLWKRYGRQVNVTDIISELRNRRNRAEYMSYCRITSPRRACYCNKHIS